MDDSCELEIGQTINVISTKEDTSSYHIWFCEIIWLENTSMQL